MKISRFLYLLVAIVCLLSCGNHRSSTKQVFRYNESSNIASLDPAFAKNQSVIWAVHQLYNTLVETGPDLSIRPSLARRWEVSDDRLTYTFYLRNDVYFHDSPVFPGGRGRRMVAGDVAYSLQRIVDPATASSGAWIFNGRVDTARAFTAISDTVFVLRLKSPFTPVLGLLSMQYCSVVPHEVIGRYGRDFRSHPCGTGPFRFGSWREGEDMVLLRNEHYFEQDSTGRRLPYLDAVKISFYTSKAAEFLMLRQGKIDFINDIDASFKDEVLNKRGSLKEEWKNELVLSKHPYLNIQYLGILVDSTLPAIKNSPLRLKRIRQAINYGFDRRKMMMYLRNSIGIPAESGFIPAGLPSFDSGVVKGYHYDPSLARTLLAEAGFPGGRGVPPVRLLTVAVYSELAGFIARELENIGLDVRVEVVQKGLLLEQTAKSQAAFFLGSWIADYPDGENFMSVFYGKNPAPPNYTRYKNPSFDRLYEMALSETNDSLRHSIYRRLDAMMIADAPVVPLWYDEVIRLASPRLLNFHPNGLNLLELRTVSIRR